MASKLSRIIAALFVIFTMSTPPAFGQETPADTEASAPVEKMSLATGDYTGTWMTPGFPALPSKLTIKSIDNTQARVRYEWGDEDNGGHVTVPAATILPDGSLTWGGGSNGPKFTFRLNEDGTLHGLREVQAGKSEVTMTKVPNAG